MTHSDDAQHPVSDTIAQRVGVGPDPTVTGWQNFLVQILEKMKPYLAAGRLVTFQALSAEEKTFFKGLVSSVTIPSRALALYLPPSVRYQMMYTNHGSDARYDSDHHPDRPPDAGVLLASSEKNFEVILNSLFAHPPTLAAVDVYERGSLIGGYTYPSITACQESLSELLQTYLGR
ncbi:MAG: hypothetical protein WBG37_04540 [Desulfobacterales bacterium]